jgi:hypothetical protein
LEASRSSPVKFHGASTTLNDFIVSSQSFSLSYQRSKVNQMVKSSSSSSKLPNSALSHGHYEKKRIQEIQKVSRALNQRDMNTHIHSHLRMHTYRDVPRPETHENQFFISSNVSLFLCAFFHHHRGLLFSSFQSRSFERVIFCVCVCV